MRNSVAKVERGKNYDVAISIEEGMLQWIGHVERIGVRVRLV